MKLPAVDLSSHNETLWAVILGALLATASGFLATQLEAWFRRRERERNAALLFGEVLSTIALLLEIADDTRGTGDPYGPVTMRMLLAARREIDVYDRNREQRYDRRDAAGSGAAGGVGFAAHAWMQSTFRPGAAVIAEIGGLEQAVQGASFVITGEGRMDAQTLLGKTPMGVAQIAQRAGVPTIAIAGSLGAGYQGLYRVGIEAAFSLVSGPMSLTQACENVAVLLEDRAEDVVRLWLTAAKH